MTTLLRAFVVLLKAMVFAFVLLWLGQYLGLHVREAGGTLVRAAQAPPLSLEQLTVPTERLSAECRLPTTDAERLDGNRVRGGLWAGLPITSNPWTGNDAVILSRIRARLDPAPRVADGPPLNKRQLARYQLHLADGVGEGYAALYAQAGSNLVTVYGLRFSTAADANTVARSTRADDPRAVRILIGSIVVVASGDGDCFETVSAYLRSLAR